MMAASSPPTMPPRQQWHQRAQAPSTAGPTLEFQGNSIKLNHSEARTHTHSHAARNCKARIQTQLI